MTALDWTELDSRAVDTARVLAADAVQKVGNGHPGTAISLAPVAYLLYQKVMNVDPADEHWLGRDRFVLSAGHSSLTQYCQLYLGGFGLELADIEALRTWGSLTPGHPEVGHTRFIECTTGPLGAGMPEWGMLPIPTKLLKAGVSDMLRLSDARMSGTSYGGCLLHCAPEAHVGGPLALVRSGDRITVDVPARRIHLEVDDAELERRRAAWTPPPERYQRGWGWMFARHVLQADQGCDFDFLETSFGAAVPEPDIY